MAKGQDSKKATKKKPEKTMKEKRLDKKEKKASKSQIALCARSRSVQGLPCAVQAVTADPKHRVNGAKLQISGLPDAAGKA